MGKNDSCRIVFFIIIVEGISLFNKDLRHRLTEPIDTLLDIPYHEEIILSRHTLKDHILRCVGVLIFINQHKSKLLRKFLCKRCFFPCTIFFFDQQLHCKMFQIRKVKQASYLLCLHQPSVVVEHKLKQCLDSRTKKTDILRKTFLIHTKQLFGKLL